MIDRRVACYVRYHVNQAYQYPLTRDAPVGHCLYMIKSFPNFICKKCSHFAKYMFCLLKFPTNKGKEMTNVDKARINNFGCILFQLQVGNI